ncbi:MAG: CinA family nicotinamide mononucleotide deamidase-related protein [Desulfurivibrionaceae bacterium]|nr:CinA family nicotinamide mononucleotide deamidase-related protein [Desulfurivibrionaceae bacterium]
MIGEIIAIGDELTSGRILNTTSYFAAGQLFAAGHEVKAMTTIGDDPELIGKTLLDSLARADFVIVTGGLGATSDDLTSEAVADALDRPATFYPEILQRIRAANNNGSPQPRPSLEKLAWLPAGAHALKFDASTAGYFLVHGNKPIFFLPGVPHEMEELLVETVISRLAVWEGEEVRRVGQRLYRVAGLPETAINERLAPLAEGEERIRIGYYPVFPEVHVSLTVVGTDVADMERLFGEIDAKIRNLLGDNLYGTGTDSLETVIGRLLIDNGMVLALAESCTGGLIAHRITRVPGSSEYFLGGAVTYSNELKERMLGVEGELLAEYGAVSPETARAMAEGIRRETGADIALAVTGIAGPSGGTVAKPVGTVYFGLATAGGTEDSKFSFNGARWQIQEAACNKGLDILRLAMLRHDYAKNQSCQRL